VIDSDEARSTTLFLGVSEGPATPIFVLRSEVSMGAGETEIRCAIERLPLPRGRYYLWAGVVQPGLHNRNLLPWQPVSSFEVVGPDLDPAPQAVVRLAPVYVKATWDVAGH
jgi:hypothetical protein